MVQTAKPSYINGASSVHTGFVQVPLQLHASAVPDPPPEDRRLGRPPAVDAAPTVCVSALAAGNGANQE
jgi:hypothetical protein